MNCRFQDWVRSRQARGESVNFPCGACRSCKTGECEKTGLHQFRYAIRQEVLTNNPSLDLKRVDSVVEGIIKYRYLVGK